jgi:2,5-furandicarboxylate decarboxylase 1
MTAGGLHRFHAVVQVRKATPQHDGLQHNAIFAAFGALKDLDLVIVVDEDIDIRDPHDVEYALATRMEASRDLLVMPAARGHEYIRVGQQGIRANSASMPPCHSPKSRALRAARSKKSASIPKRYRRMQI